MSLRDLRARSGRASGKDPGAEPSDGSAGRGPETVLPAGCELVGRLRFPGSVRIEGRVEGEVEAARRVVVGEGARLEAGLRAEEVEIHGHVCGDVVALRNTTLTKGARVEGEIRTVGIVVEEGARFQGCIVIGSDEDGAESRPEAESATDATATATKPAAGEGVAAA